MTESLPKVVFEYPLNEKIRIWLRVEFLLKQLHANTHFNHDNALLFFHTLSELLEIIERNDIRSDLLKELELQKQKLAVWLNVDGVDASLLSSLLARLTALSTELNANSRFGLELKDDKFISAIRQRLTIPGGCCSFDLPSLYLWINLPQEERDKQVKAWAETFNALQSSLTLCMQLLRQAGRFQTLTCHKHFYQDTNEEAELLRIRLYTEQRIYPQVSGHKSRYAIRFLPFDHQADDSLDFEFELACC